MTGLNLREDATLYVQLPMAGGDKITRAVHVGPLQSMIELALSGRYGPVSVLLIETESGFVIDHVMLAEAACKRGSPSASGR